MTAIAASPAGPGRIAGPPASRPYAEMGYFDADYEPKDTDILARVPHHAAARASTRSRRRPPWPASPRPRPGRWSGPTA